MSTHGSDSLAPASGELSLQPAALRDRIDRELPRNTPGRPVSTEAVGGWSKLGARLDGVLRALFETMCAEHALEPATTWARLTQSPWDRATAGMVAHILTTAWAHTGTQHPLAHVLLADLRAPHSALRAVIACRNALVHDRPPPLEGLEALVRLRSLLGGLV